MMNRCRPRSTKYTITRVDLIGDVITMNMWKLSHADVCDCGERQTMSHMRDILCLIL